MSGFRMASMKVDHSKSGHVRFSDPLRIQILFKPIFELGSKLWTFSVKFRWLAGYCLVPNLNVTVIQMSSIGILTEFRVEIHQAIL